MVSSGTNFETYYMMWALLTNKNFVLFVLFMISTLYKMWQAYKKSKNKKYYLTKNGDMYTK